MRPMILRVQPTMQPKRPIKSLRRLKVLLLAAVFAVLAAESASGAVAASDLLPGDLKNDVQEDRKGIWVASGKKDSLRHYSASFTRTVDLPLEKVKALVMSFEKKCNNDWKDKRKWKSQDFDCEFHNQNIVEARREPDSELLEKKPGHQIYSRHGYNQGDFFYQELITEKARKDSQGRDVIEVRHQMLSEKEAAKWVKTTLKNTSVFQTTQGTFRLTALSPKQTEVEYVYFAETSHWLLNKAISVSKVFDGMQKALEDLWAPIKKEGSPLIGRH